MIDAVVGFAALLRRYGIGVGSDRTLLAARALHLVDVTDRDATRRALRLTLLVSGADAERFDELFERWFTGAALAGDGLTEFVDIDGGDDADDQAAAEPLIEVRADAVGGAYVDDPAEQVAVTSDDSSDERRRGASNAIGSDDAETVTRFDLTDAVGAVDGSSPPGDADRDDPGGDGDDVAIELAVGDDAGFDDLAALRRMLDDAHRAQQELLARPDRSAGATFRPNSVLANPFERAEQRTLDAAVREMWPDLVGAPAWRRRAARQGELDLRRTMRRSVTLGGVPAVVRHRAPAATRPDLLVLVDTSVSMRPTVRLMLHLAHALRRRPGRVRVLGFVDECVDVTDVIRHVDLAHALGSLLDDAPGGPLDPSRPSDYGTALTSLWHRFARLLRPTTTVVVLGDGRSNGRDPGFALVSELTERCRRTVWCTPEPEGAWSFGNGEMAGYSERVDSAMTIRSLADLVDAVHRGAFAAPSVRSRDDGPELDRAVVSSDDQRLAAGMPADL